MKSNPIVRRTIVMLLTGIYFLGTSGFVLEKQFCCGKLSGINFSIGNESKCPMCSKNKNCKKGCCNSKYLFQKIDDSQKISKQIKINQIKYDILVFTLPNYFHSTIENDLIVNIEAFTIPPLRVQESVFIVNRTIRI